MYRWMDGSMDPPLAEPINALVHMRPLTPYIRQEGGGGDEKAPERVARVYCDPSELAVVCKGLQDAGWAPGLVQFSYVPKVRRISSFLGVGVGGVDALLVLSRWCDDDT